MNTVANISAIAKSEQGWKTGALPHDNVTCADSDQQTLRTRKTKRTGILKVVQSQCRQIQKKKCTCISCKGSEGQEAQWRAKDTHIVVSYVDCELWTLYWTLFPNRGSFHFFKGHYYLLVAGKEEVSVELICWCASAVPAGPCMPTVWTENVHGVFDIT